MENIFNELPTALPFYESEVNQEIYKESVDENLFYKLYSPKNAFLPFQIQMPVGKVNPVKWEIISFPSKSAIDISNNLNKIKIYEFQDFKQAVYFGDELRFVYGQRDEPLNLPCGYYYTKISFADGSCFVSEIFYVAPTLENFMKVEFWCEKDLLPVVYRNEWKQVLYLPTFVHNKLPEIEEETSKDGYNSEIPVWQKMVFKYKFIDIVPDFLKTVLISLQLQDFVYLWINEKRQGRIDRIFVVATPDDIGIANEVEVTFEDDVMIKTSCPQQNTLINLSSW